jgi:LPS-assembly protein
MHKNKLIKYLSSGLICSFLICSSNLFAQTTAQDVILFKDDVPANVLAKELTKNRILKSRIAGAPDSLKVNGGTVEFDQQKKALKLKDSVIASSQTFQIQSDGATINTETQEGEFTDKVIISHPEFSLSCDSAYVNAPYQVGVFRNSKVRMEVAEVFADTETFIKSSEEELRMYNSSLTTCDTSERPLPWQVMSDEIDITVDGYAHSYWSSVYAYGVPVLYVPYLGFPVKEQRSSGLLIPDIGYSNQDGITAEFPTFFALDDATDLIVSPLYAQLTRYGARTEFRRLFSQQHSLQGKVIVSDESPRGQESRGLVIPEAQVDAIDKNRLGVFFREDWYSDPDSEIPISFLSDIHYVSDDFMLRELPDDDIGLRNATFLSSKMALRTTLGSFGNAQLSGEFNQLMDGNLLGTDDTVLHRLPELNVGLIDTYRPFGFNPLGIKVVGGANINITEFSRQQGYDGTRVSINPEITIPFHVQNYFSAAIGIAGYDTQYLTNLQDGEEVPFSDSSDRRTAVASAVVSTAVEKVYDIEEGGFLATLTELGSLSSQRQLQRIKHTIEPQISFAFAPDVNQDNNPFYDALDRIRQRSLVTYGFRTSLLGRFDPRSAYQTSIQEFTSPINELPELGYQDSFLNLRTPLETLTNRAPVSSRVGMVGSLATFSMFQTYDYLEAQDDADPIREALSDIASSLVLTPNPNFSLGVDGNYSPDRQTLSSWRTGLTFADDRQDSFTLAYAKVNPLAIVENQVVPGTNIENIQAQLEFVLTDQIRLGYFGRYDAEVNDFIDQVAALRFINGCDCWRFDFEVSNRTNPDRQRVNVRLTLSGLGDITQGFQMIRSRDDSFQ